MRVEIKKTLLGKYTVGYDCPRCKTRLTSPIDDAGKSDQCPDCGATFVVPGKEQRERFQAEQAATAKRVAEEKAAKVAAKQAAKAAIAASEQRTIEMLQPPPPPAEVVPFEVVAKRCPYCAEQIQPNAIKCRHCGEFLNAKPALPSPVPPSPVKESRKKFWLVCGGILFFIVVINGIIDDNRRTGSADTSSASTSQKWYEGGTLLEAGALDWQNATYENKLATAADMVASLWMAKAFKPHLQAQLDSMDDLRVMSDEMVDFIDAFTRKESDSTLNRQMYTNQTVRQIGALGAVTMGWMK